LVQMHFQVVNPLILTLTIDVQMKKSAKSLAISLRQSTIARQEVVRKPSGMGSSGDPPAPVGGPPIGTGIRGAERGQTVTHGASRASGVRAEAALWRAEKAGSAARLFRPLRPSFCGFVLKSIRLLLAASRQNNDGYHSTHRLASPALYEVWHLGQKRRY
jgi:hypothetical protein